MGESKRRKKLDPNYGKSKPSELQEVIAEILVLAALMGIELWKKDNPDINWEDFFLTKIKEIALSPEFAGFNAYSTEDYLKAATGLFFTTLVCNHPVSFTSRQNFYDFLIDKATNTTTEEIANLLNRTTEEKKFINTCAMELAAI
ncbi:MAG TPA: hypothetical protein VIQ31_32140 [Phormidium sp.]